jgi:hypothetical protein
MHRVFLAMPVLLSILFTTACVPDTASERSEPSESDACSALPSATSVQILLPPGITVQRKSSYLITDPQAVRRLIDFVTQRKTVTPPSVDTPPTPKLRAIFFNGARHVAIFGTGSGVFYLQCGTVRGTRYASAAETAEFQMLITPPDSAQ